MADLNEGMAQVCIGGNNSSYTTHTHTHMSYALRHTERGRGGTRSSQAP
jgi:hypothetical protein